MTPSRVGETSDGGRGLSAPLWWTFLAASAALGVGVQAEAYVRGAQDLLRTVAFVGLQLGVLGASVHLITAIHQAIRTISGDQPPGPGPEGAEGPTGDPTAGARGRTLGNGVLG